jgi:hypothetical protein
MTRALLRPALPYPRRGLNQPEFTQVSRPPALLLTVHGTIRRHILGGKFPILVADSTPCKCLWKLMFFGHSLICLNMALWMLRNMETSQLHVGLKGRGESKPRG